MRTEDAVRQRIKEIANQKNRSINEICLSAGLPPNTLYDSLRKATKAPSIKTIKKFCFGAGLTLKEFFDRPYFNDDDEWEI